jgi:hypothetical protein
VRLGATEQDGDLVAREQLPDPLGERPRAGRRVVELAIEVVQ